MISSAPSKEALIAIGRFANLLEEFRKFDPEMQVQTILTYLLVASRDSESLPSISEIAENLGISQASASRNVMALADVTRHRTAGHQLVESFENPMRRTQKLVQLTPKGRRVLQSLIPAAGVKTEEV